MANPEQKPRSEEQAQGYRRPRPACEWNLFKRLIRRRQSVHRGIRGGARVAMKRLQRRKGPLHFLLYRRGLCGQRGLPSLLFIQSLVPAPCFSGKGEDLPRRSSVLGIDIGSLVSELEIASSPKGVPPNGHGGSFRGSPPRSAARKSGAGSQRHTRRGAGGRGKTSPSRESRRLSLPEAVAPDDDFPLKRWGSFDTGRGKLPHSYFT